MSNSLTSEQIDAIAADFVVRADHVPLSTAEQAELDVWLSENSRHLGAYLRALAVFEHAKRAKALGPHFDPDNLSEDLSIETVDRATPKLQGRFGGRALMRFGGLAAAAVILIAIAWPGGDLSYETEFGKVKTVSLEDGSQITLNTATKITVGIDGNLRHVNLEEGEAFFEVVPDAERPFIVVAGETRAKVVGTKFNVLHLAGQPIEIMVKEGSVEVGEVSVAKAKKFLISSNNQAIISQKEGLVVHALSSADIDRRLSWRHGMLSFENTPLAQTAELFSRYSRVHIEIIGAEIAAEPITGYFSSDNPLAFAQTVAEVMRLKLQHTGDTIVLSKTNAE